MFSYHLAELPARTTARAMARPPRPGQVPGLRHAEVLAFMQLGAPTASLERMQLRRVAVFARWEEEGALDRFLEHHPLGIALSTGWHVRMEFLRRYGTLACLPDLPTKAGDWDRGEPVVAVTLARLQLPQLPRFLKWGKPVERLVVSHPGATIALAAMRPPRHFSTFSIWRSVEEMTAMVHGHSDVENREVHAAAMREQARRDFHHESAFMRFRPLAEHGRWQGRDRLLPG
ncbi:hypothetical protein E8D34_03000 [Nocardioides sp. GY 10113]|uniref:hypothetical protein n=1 Tax=Nocardioides sp. GY 10113 TaxID=2569761 RepID=UPI0010A7908C|nr:hypothetical protein [Nocardioides sp. GY 10113]TIC88658.1 hypothetical protein E8D34_03000 [Nocardioides sp. GY 10113]